MAKNLSIFTQILFLFFFAGIFIYVVFMNKENHTGFNFNWLLILSSIAVLVQLIFVATKKTTAKLFIKTILPVALLVLFIIYNERFNVMMEYGHWLSKGQPGRSYLLPFIKK